MRRYRTILAIVFAVLVMFVFMAAISGGSQTEPEGLPSLQPQNFPVG